MITFVNLRKTLARSFFLSFLGILVFSVSPSYAATFTRSVFIQNVTPSQVEFRWVTDTTEPLIVKYGLTTTYGSQVNSDTVSGTGGSNNHAKITGLTANTKYYYQVTTSAGAALTPAGDATYYIRTAPPTGSSTPFSFAAWGDSGDSSSSQDAVARQVAAKAPNLTFIAGDIAYPYTTDFANNNGKYFNHYKDSMRFSPFYVACGNHETSCPTVVADHSLPGGGNMGGALTSYSFDYGNVHFVSLNSNGSFAYNPTSVASSDPQVRWAYNDLKGSSQPWKVMYWHHNGWSAGSHSTQSNIVTNLMKLASDTGTNLVFWGHSHTYERWPVNAGGFTKTQFYTIGDGGRTGSTSCKNLNPACVTGAGYSSPTVSGTTISTAGFLWFQVNGNTMTANYIGSGGKTEDVITLSTSGSGPTSPPVTNPPTSTPTLSPTRPPNATSTPTPTTPQGSTNTPTLPPTGNALLRVEAGGSADYTDSAGNVWSADSGFSGGSTVDRGNISISGTNDQRIYQTERYGMSGYSFSVPNGDYSVRLHFAETSGSITAAGQRVFSVDVEGQTLSNIDVFSEAGGRNTALVKSVDATVNDGQLNISFAASVQNPEINGIEIVPQGSTGCSSSADSNGDGNVDGIDFITWMNNYDQSLSGVSNGDYYPDGKVDGIDYVIWLQDYGSTGSCLTPTRSNTNTPTRVNTATPTQPGSNTSTPTRVATATPTRVNTNTPTQQITQQPTATGPVPTQPPGGSNPLTDCTKYGSSPKRMFLETQAWWMDTKSIGTAEQLPLNGIGGHAHTATCFPQDQQIAGGTLHFDVRLMIHKGNRGRVEWLDIGLGPDGTSIARVNLPNLTCAGATDPKVQCEWWVPIDLDTSKVPAGYQELRFRFNVIQPNGERMFASTGWQAWYHGGTSHYRTPPYVEARGWYVQTAYENARITTALPYSPVSGTFSFSAHMAPGSGGKAVGTHGVHVDAKFNFDDFGHQYVQGNGSFDGTVSIDTTQLTNGPHCVALRTSSVDVGGGTDTGVFQFPIFVNNPGHPSGNGKGGCQPGT